MKCFSRFALAVSVLFGLACHGTGALAAESAPAKSRIAVSENGGVISVRPLDDPQNPYAGQYNAYDRWVFDNYIEVAPGLLQQPDGGQSALKEILARYPKGTLTHWAYVDSEGWAIPLAAVPHPIWKEDSADTLRKYLDAPMASPGEGVLAPFHFLAAGVLTPEAALGQQMSFLADKAALYPPIPAWLGEHPPLETVFVPNGEILTYGPLDLHVEDPERPHAEMMLAGELWYRYTPEGQLLGTYKGGGNGYYSAWQTIYWPEHLKVTHLQQRAVEKPRLSTYNWAGMSIVYEASDSSAAPGFYMSAFEDSSPHKIVAAYDYDGTVLDPDSPVSASRRILGDVVWRSELQALFELQVQQGLTRRGDPGPFWGKADGPVVVYPAPQAPKRIATKGSFVDGDYVVIRPLDDPANPYASAYGPWDLWRLDNIGRNDPLAQQAMNETFQRQRAEMEAAKKENREPDPAIMQNQGYRQPASNPWKHYDLYVSPQGWLLPQTEDWKRDLAFYGSDLRLASPGYRPLTEFRAQAGGVMDDATRKAEEAAQLQFELPLWPAIPQWLGSQPVICAVFLPDGSVMTMGPLGSRPADFDTSYDSAEAKALTKQWYLYSSDGSLLRQFPATDSYRWMIDLHPETKQIWENAKLQGYEAMNFAGYIMLRGKDGKLVSAMEYDGSPADISQPLVRAKYYCYPHYWQKLAGIYALQQRQ